MNLPVATKTYSKTAALQRMIVERTASESVPFQRQLHEMLQLWLRNGISPFAYHRMGLYRTSLTWEQKKEFASRRWYRSRIDRINHPGRRIASWNKIVAAGVLRSFHIPTPPFYGFVSPVNGQATDGLPLRSPRDLDALIDRARLTEACFKLVNGRAGRGFLRVSFKRREGTTIVKIAPSRTLVTLDAFWRDYLENGHGGASPRDAEYGYLCEGVVEQHPAVSSLHRESLNTVRVWMAQRSPGHWEMMGAVLRMGIGPDVVDGNASGCIAAPVDLESGRLGRAVYAGKGRRPFREFDRHPTSDAQIREFSVPTWDSVLPLCIRVCAAFPYFRFIGIDVAIAPDGPVVMEVEADPDEFHQAHLGRGFRPVIDELHRARRWMPPR